MSGTRVTIPTTCRRHGARGFCDLLVTKEPMGLIVLNVHAADMCVIELDEQAATTLTRILTDWLG
jgi:hypothetical protein